MAQIPEESKVVLDSSSFKALASETRVLILKELDKKRCTATEIAKALRISVQAASEHLENLRIAGLVERADEGRKWVYFALTEKGKTVLHPESGKRLWVLVSLFILIIASAGYLIFQGGQITGISPVPAPQEKVFSTPESLNERGPGVSEPAGAAPPGLMAVASQDNQTNPNSTNSTLG